MSVAPFYLLSFSSTASADPGDSQSSEGTWEKLSQIAVKSAEFDSPERQPHPKCLEGTRVDLLDYIQTLLDNREKSQLIWLHGTAGVGKSAIAFTVAERIRGTNVTAQQTVQKRLAGTFFFSRKHTKCSTTGYFFATLAYQLASNFASVREDMKRAIFENPALLDSEKSLREQMEALFLRPLWGLRFRLRDCPPPVFVIDALDECNPETQLTDLISLLGQALHKPDLPVIHILLTSRSEAHIREAIQGKDVLPLVCEIPTSGEGPTAFISLDGAGVDNDICVFLEHFFRQRQSYHPDFPQPTRDQFVRLARRAGRRFIVASTMVKFIDDGYSDPRDRLDLMLSLTSEFLPGTELYKLYDSILFTCGDPERAYLLLSVVAALVNPLPISQISKLLGPGDGKDVEKTLVQLQSLIKIPTDSSLPVDIYHSSIRDYVSDPSNCGISHVRHTISPHALLARSSFRLMMKTTPQTATLLDALLKLQRWDVMPTVMSAHDPQVLKHSLAFIVEPPEPLQVLICLLWLRGDRSSGLQFWLETRDGHAWLETQSGLDWLCTRGGDNWLETQRGWRWLETQNGQDWLETQNGREWLETPTGRRWLQTPCGREWLQTGSEREWLQTQRGRHWLRSRGAREWLQTQRGQDWLLVQDGRDWLQTQDGQNLLWTSSEQEWLQTQNGQEWLQTPSGRVWLEIQSGQDSPQIFNEQNHCVQDCLQTQSGRDWLQTRSGRHWLHTQSGIAWLRSQEGRGWLLNPEGGQTWFFTPSGVAWQQTQSELDLLEGQDWLETRRGRDKLQTPGHWLQTLSGQEWLQTPSGREWLQTPVGREWLQSWRDNEWLQTKRGKEWLQSCSGRDWLRTQGGRNWLQTWTERGWLQKQLQTEMGQEWLLTQSGRRWLLTLDGRDWFQSPSGWQWLQGTVCQDWLQNPSGRQWLRTPEGRQWLPTEGGRQWLQTLNGSQWLHSSDGRDWLRMQTLGGQNWLHTPGGKDWLQTQNGRQWLQTPDGRDWLQTRGGQDWLQTPSGRHWLQSQRGQDWLRTPHGQAWQLTPAASVWVPMEEFSSTLQAISKFTIDTTLPLLPVFQVIQHFKSLPDFLISFRCS